MSVNTSILNVISDSIRSWMFKFAYATFFTLVLAILSVSQTARSLDPTFGSGGTVAFHVVDEDYGRAFVPSATITVTNTNDTGPGSLRQAIAEITPGGIINFDAAVFSTPQTITVTSGQLVISRSVKILGPGMSLLSISGNDLTRIFAVNPYVVATLDGLTIRHGNSGFNGGGGIYNVGALIVTNSTISENVAGQYGGGGISSTGPLTISNSIISRNTAAEGSSGGGIRCSGGLTIANSTVHGNSAIGGGTGGGIWVDSSGGGLTISSSTVSGNTAPYGAGIMVDGDTGGYGVGLVLNSSTVSGNADGGGISVYRSSASINDSTVSGNIGYGVDIHNDTIYGETLTITNSTVSGNSFGVLPGVNSGLLVNTIVADNLNGDIDGPVQVASHSLIGNGNSSGGIVNGVNGNIVGINPLLGPLQNNGGPTMTHALLTGSRAINAGDNCVLIENGCGYSHPPQQTDQRGVSRKGNVDIGAFELSPRSAPFDFDGDGRADISVFRPSDSSWFLNRSTQGFSATRFGLPTDQITPADYDGDGKADIAIYRDGAWWWIKSATSTVEVMRFGQAGDVPVPADFTGDGRAELAVFRSGVWWTLDLTSNRTAVTQWGISTDKPVVGDYDGDGRADYAVYRDGTWYLLQSSQGFSALQFGLPADKPVVGDYDGDGKADTALFRNGTWYLQQSARGFLGLAFGQAADIPTPADYDGDGKTDIGVYRNGIWYISRSQQGLQVLQFGLPGDQAIPSAYVP